MQCEKKECGQMAIQKGRHIKSRHPYIAMTYYCCEQCGISFSIESSLGEILIPNDPEAILPKDKLPVITKLVEQIG
jgi:hypothetical protein